MRVRIHRFLSELKRRRVYTVTAVYSAGAFALLQGVQVVLQSLHAPDAAMTVLTVTAIGGLPAALVLSWVFDLTPEGVKVTPPAPPPDRRTIAILPLVVRSLGESEASFIAHGMHDDLVTQLSKVRSLRVLSRQAVAAYAGTSVSAREIGRELGAGTIMEGSVAVAGGRLRLNVQLLDAETAAYLWGESYERPLSVESLLAVQAEIAAEVAPALAAQLSPEERATIGAPPTASLEAYELYLRGNAFAADRFAPEAGVQAIEMYEGAVRLDPGFALAWARLAQTRAFHAGYFDRSRETRDGAVLALERATALAPLLAETRVAAGYVRAFVHQDLRGALTELEAIRRMRPSDDELLWLVGSLRRRLGELDASRADFGAAIALNPRSHVYRLEAATNDHLRDRWPEAEAQYRKAIELAPQWSPPYVGLSALYGRWEGHDEDARRVLEEGGRRMGAGTLVPHLVAARLRPHALWLGGALHDAILALDPVAPDAGIDAGALAVTQGEILHLRGDGEAARTAFAEARRIQEERLAVRPAEHAFHAELALALAGLGCRDAALRAGRRSLELLPVGRDALGGAALVVSFVDALVLCGELDAALEELEVLRTQLLRPSAYNLRTWPQLEPLRAHPGFPALLARW